MHFQSVIQSIATNRQNKNSQTKYHIRRAGPSLAVGIMPFVYLGTNFSFYTLVCYCAHDVGGISSCIAYSAH